LVHGKVVDMFYFPFAWKSTKLVANLKEFYFFNAIFNIADMAILPELNLDFLNKKKVFHHN
jgi:signal peptidase II